MELWPKSSTAQEKYSTPDWAEISRQAIGSGGTLLLWASVSSTGAWEIGPDECQDSFLLKMS